MTKNYEKKFIKITPETLPSIEVPSSSCSKVYVPIKTSKLIEALKPEFEFVRGYKMGTRTTKHYVELRNTERNEVIRIYNSFDRTWAFSAYLISDNIQFPIITDGRVIHKGNLARSIEDINDIKAEILEILPKVSELRNNLQNESVEPDSEIVNLIKDVIFKDTIKRYEKRNGVSVTIENNIDTIVEKLKEHNKNFGLYRYINLLTKQYIEGDYTIKDENGKTRKGRKVTSAFGKIKIISSVSKVLIEELPEYFI